MLYSRRMRRLLTRHEGVLQVAAGVGARVSGGSGTSSDLTGLAPSSGVTKMSPAGTWARGSRATTTTPSTARAIRKRKLILGPSMTAPVLRASAGPHHRNPPRRVKADWSAWLPSALPACALVDPGAHLAR